MIRQLLSASAAVALSVGTIAWVRDAGRSATTQASAVCPMRVPGALASAADWPGGAMLTFETRSSQNLAALRQRVHQWAQMFELHATQLEPGQGVGGSGSAGEVTSEHGPSARTGAIGQIGKAGVLELPASWVSVQDTARGARILFTPEQGSQLTALRGAVQQYERHLVNGECPVLAPTPGSSVVAPVP